MSDRIAFFDFDGTITTKDTLLEFIKFSKGKWLFYVGFLLYSPYLVAFKLKIISNQSAKEHILRFFFKKTPLAVFGTWCDQFVSLKLPSLLRPKAIEEIRQLQAKGVTVVIVSASPENWIRPWAEFMNVSLIATRLVVEDGLISGKIMECNCHGEEKVNRINQCYALKEYTEIYAYGDSKGDLPMLKLADIPFYKPFR